MAIVVLTGIVFAALVAGVLRRWSPSHPLLLAPGEAVPEEAAPKKRPAMFQHSSAPSALVFPAARAADSGKAERTPINIQSSTQP